MRFYDVDNALQEAITAADKPVRLKIEIKTEEQVVTVTDQDIIEANFWGIKETAGGVSSRGEVILKGVTGNIRPGAEVRVFFSIGEGLSYFQRFVFYLDEKGVQDLRGPGRVRRVRLGLLDLSYKLRKSDEARDWTSPAVFAYSVVCDKSQPEKSLVHGIVQRAGLAVTDIDCSTIPVTLPYVQLKRNIWSELSSLVTAYRCHLECAVEKPLVFAHSPYQAETLLDDEISHVFTGSDIFYFGKISREELYRNSIRLKVNMPVSLEKQEIWRYEDSPVFYDDSLQAHYPFRYPLVRKIEAWDYQARYRVTGNYIALGNGKERDVIYADEIDTKEEAENRLDFDVQINNEQLTMNNGILYYSQYDITTHNDRALLKLCKIQDVDLYHAAIHGRPIILDLNRSFFIRDDREINQHGTAALNVSGPYFSDYEIEGRPQYQDWAVRELAARIRKRHEFTVKTHRGLFHARVGAKVQVTTNSEQVTGKINAFSFRYKRNKAFVAAFKIREQ